MTNQAEETFQARAEEVAEKLEQMTREVRRQISGDYSAIGRAGSIIYTVHWGIANMSFETLIKRAALADKGRDNE